MYHTEKGKKAAITRVGALDGDCFEIVLSGGHTIFLELADRTGEPEFSALIERGVFDKPQTDGERLYWPGGPSLTLEEIMGMLKEEAPPKKKEDLKK